MSKQKRISIADAIEVAVQQTLVMAAQTVKRSEAKAINQLPGFERDTSST
jgi:hypothetical protein